MSFLLSYKGWVPTVNGRLSFKIIGECRHPSVAEYANLGTHSFQYVIALQARHTSDVLFYKLISGLLQVSGEFNFVFCARSRRGIRSPNDPLIGRVYVMRPKSDGDRQLAEHMPSWLNFFREAEYGASESTVTNTYKNVHQTLSDISDLSCNIVLHRNGIISISKLVWSDRTLYDNSEAYSIQENADVDHGLADQIYYFVRDISHQHQHHSPDADTIITTYPVTGRTLDWCNRVVYSLYYYIINSKRRLEPTEQVRVLGVLAYLRSFKQIANDRAAESSIALSLPFFNDEATKDSINATKGYLDLKFAERKQNSDKYRTVLFTITATLLTLVSFVSGFADPAVETAGWVRSLANFVKVHAYVCFLAPFCILVWWLSDLLVRPNYEAKRDAVRLSFVNRPIFALIAGLIALVLLYLAWIWLTDSASQILN